MLNVCLVAMGSDSPIRETQKLLAPYVLKRYSEVNVTPKNALNLFVVDFGYDSTPTDIATRILKGASDIVSFSLYVWNYPELMECARILKEQAPHILIVCGGPMVSFTPLETLKKHPYIDIISNDNTRGEIIFSGLMQVLVRGGDLKEVRGITYRLESGDLCRTEGVTHSIEFTEELSPYLNGDIILEENKEYFLTIETSRGCPFKCGYCVWGGERRRMEWLPIERIFKEIELIFNHPSVNHVLFIDSTMVINKPRLKKIVEHIQKQSRYREITTSMHLHINAMDESTTKILATLPGFLFDFGLQTIDPVALNLIDQNRSTAEQFKEKIENIRTWVPNANLAIDLMLGLPGDTLVGFKKTLAFCLQLRVSRLYLAYPICLLPGTRFYQERDALGLHYSDTDPLAIISTDTFPDKDILEALRVGTWVQILLYYYKGIAEFFYNYTTAWDGESQYHLIEKWINCIEDRVKLFASVDPSQFRGNVTKDWYLMKGGLLELASSPENAYIIYDTIHDHIQVKDDLYEQTIGLGLNVFSFYSKNGIIPELGNPDVQLLKQHFNSYSDDNLKKVHSIFKK